MKDLLRSINLPDDALTPDRHDLDNQFERHPQMLADVADGVASARKDLDAAKAAHANKEREVRLEKIDEYGDKKVTVKDLDAAVQSDPEVRRAERIVSAAEYVLKRWDGLLSAMQAKTSALKHLSELYQAGYFTTNRSSTPRRMRRDD